MISSSLKMNLFQKLYYVDWPLLRNYFSYSLATTIIFALGDVKTI